MKQKIRNKKMDHTRPRVIVDISKKIAMFLASMIITLLMLEIALRISYPLWADYNTEMWRYATQLKRLSDAPDVGHEHIPNKSAYLYGTEIRTNSLGLRADRDYTIPKPKGTKRILVLGDSITMGWGVNYSDTYPQVLESLLNENNENYEVINAGVGNYNINNEIGALKKYSMLDPDIIIIGFYINDIEDITYPVMNSITRNSYLYVFLLDKYIILSANNYQTHYLNQYKSFSKIKKLNQSLRQLVTDASTISQVIIFSIPEMHQFSPYPFEEVNIFLEQNIQNDILYIDLLPYLNASDAEQLWVSSEDPHPNAKAHRIMADSIYGIMKEKVDLP